MDESLLLLVSLSGQHGAEADLWGVVWGSVVSLFAAFALFFRCLQEPLQRSTLLGGGIGWLMGRFGATVDNVLAFEIATAVGHLITASADERSDLFWALRGGGGNFGVVTKITYRLHQLGPVLGGMAIFH
jgi:FAD/FMN-containing dehydrogenase